MGSNYPLMPVHPDYPAWIGRLSMALAMNAAQVEKPVHVREEMQRTLDAFLASGAPSEELRQMLKDARK